MKSRSRRPLLVALLMPLAFWPAAGLPHPTVPDSSPPDPSKIRHLLGQGETVKSSDLEPIVCPKNIGGGGYITIYKFTIGKADGIGYYYIFTVDSLPNEHFGSRAEAFRDGCAVNR